MSTEKSENSILGGLGIFGATAESIVDSVTVDEIESDGYVKHFELNPQDNKGKDFAVVKLIPSLIKGNKNIARKVSYKVNSDDGKKFMFDSKKSLGWRENECIVADTRTKIKKDNDTAKLERFGQVFNYKKPSTVLVQILEYKTDPSLEGKIMPLRIYEDVENLIEKTIKPSAEDIEFNAVEPHNCFDLLTGNALMLKASMKKLGENSDGSVRTGRSFEDSIFVKVAKYREFRVPRLDEDGEIVTKTGEDGETIETVYDIIKLDESEVEAYNKQDFQANPQLLEKLTSIVKFLQSDGVPKLEDYAYIEPSEERATWVKTLVDAIVAGEPATLGGDVVKKEDESKDSEEKSDETANVEETSDDDDGSSSEEELNDILEQAGA